MQADLKDPKQLLTKDLGSFAQARVIYPLTTSCIAYQDNLGQKYIQDLSSNEGRKACPISDLRNVINLNTCAIFVNTKKRLEIFQKEDMSSHATELKLGQENELKEAHQLNQLVFILGKLNYSIFNLVEGKPQWIYKAENLISSYFPKYPKLVLFTNGYIVEYATKGSILRIIPLLNQ